jgi:hypothetical protein
MRGGKEWEDGQSIASARRTVLLSIVSSAPLISSRGIVVVVALTGPATDIAVIVIVEKACGSSIVVIAIAVVVVVVVVVVSVGFEAVTFVFVLVLVVICFGKVRRGVSAMDGKCPKWRHGRRRDALVSSRGATGSWTRAPQRYGRHVLCG